MAEHLRQLYIDPAAVATHRVELSPPSGGYPWQRKEVDVESFLAGQVRRAEDDEMTAIMSQPQQAVPCIRWVGHQQDSGWGINRPVGGASAGRWVGHQQAVGGASTGQWVGRQQASGWGISRPVGGASTGQWVWHQQAGGWGISRQVCRCDSLGSWLRLYCSVGSWAYHQWAGHGWLLLQVDPAHPCPVRTREGPTPQVAGSSGRPGRGRIRRRGRV